MLIVAQLDPLTCDYLPARRPVGGPAYPERVQFLVVLFAVGAAIKFWPVLVGIIGLIVATYWTRRAVDRRAERVEAERRRVAGLVARADQQHAWMMQGDGRGVYGEFSPAPV